MATKKHIGVTRSKADELIGDLVQRARSINRDSEYLYRVTRLEVFGSYVSEKPKLGDIDVAVDMALKREYRDGVDFHKECVKQGRGRTFRSSLAMLMWPQEKTLRALKAGHRAFSFHDSSELEQLKADGQATGKLIFTEEGRV